MAKQSNLKNVVRFELVRNLKKPSFWLAAILLPVLLVGYIAFVSLIGSSAEDVLTAGTDTSELALGILDEAQIVDLAVTEALELDLIPVDNREQGIEATRTGELNVFYYISADFAETATIQVFTNTDSTSLFANYEQPIREALAASAATRVAPEDIIAITSVFTTETTNFTADGEEDNTLARMIIPLVALALFWVLIVMFGNRLTMATIEEKENRITEMILTTISPTTLVMGKVISLITLGVIQLAVLLIPIILFVVFTNQAADMIPFELIIDWNPAIILSSLALLVLSYVFFAGASVAVGSLVPTAKELAPYASVFMIAVMVPLFSIVSFIAPEPDIIVYVLTYFPFTAPVALMIRNAFGTLPLHELLLGIGLLTLWSTVSIKLAAIIFRRSAMNFTSALSIKTLFARKK